MKHKQDAEEDLPESKKPLVDEGMSHVEHSIISTHPEAYLSVQL